MASMHASTNFDEAWRNQETQLEESYRNSILHGNFCEKAISFREKLPFWHAKSLSNSSTPMIIQDFLTIRQTQKKLPAPMIRRFV